MHQPARRVRSHHCVEGLGEGEAHECSDRSSTANQRIAEVVARRQALAVIASRATGLEDLRRAVSSAEMEISSVEVALAETDVSAATESARSAASVAVKMIDEMAGDLDRLHRRLSRDRLVVGAIGLTRQGKSRFLQSLTGLTDHEIPTSSGGFCTGVETEIRHGTAGSAVVHFLSRAEYLDMIREYHRELKLGPGPDSLEQFWRGSLPEVARESQHVYRHLKRHHDAAAEVGPLLGAGARTIPLEQIADYVTQESAERTPLHKFLAVERVSLTAPYSAGLSSVSVLDLPGLGDTNMTDTKRLVSAVADKIDVVVMIRRPDPDGDDWQMPDIELTSHARNGLPEIDLGERAFLLLNHNRQRDNLDQCQAFLNKLDSTSIEVADAKIVDAADPKDVSVFFEGVVAALPETVARGDRALLARREAELRSALEAVGRFVELAGSVLGKATPLPEYERTRLVSEARDSLSRGLEGLLVELEETATLGSASPAGLVDAFHDAMSEAQALTETLSVQDFERRKARSGNKGTAYNEMLQETRARLGARFAELDGPLRAYLDEGKQRVVDVLREDGLLGAVLGSTDTTALKELLELLDDELLSLPERSSLRGALSTLTAVQLMYRGFLQHRIRQCFVILDPDSARYPASSFAPDGNIRDVPPQRFVDAVEQTAIEALIGEAGVQTLLQRLQVEPAWAVYALVEEFTERALHGEGAEDEWQALYRRFQDRIWRSEFDEAAAQSEKVRSLRLAVADLRKQAVELSASFHQHDEGEY